MYIRAVKTSKHRNLSACLRVNETKNEINV